MQSTAVTHGSYRRRGWCCWLQECCRFRVVNGVGLLQQWGIFYEMLGVDSRRPSWQRATSPAPWERHVSSALWYRTLFLWPPFITMYNRRLNGHCALGITWPSYALSEAVLWRPESKASLNTLRCLIKWAWTVTQSFGHEKTWPLSFSASVLLSSWDMNCLEAQGFGGASEE